MKKMKPNNCSILFSFLFLFITISAVTAQKDEEKGREIVRLNYYNESNSIQFLVVESVLKKGKEITPLQDRVFEIFLNSAEEANLIGRIKTDEKGKAKVFIPPSLKEAWDTLERHTFIVVHGEEEVIGDYMITKSKLTLDTVNDDGVRSIIATLMKMEAGEWVPVQDAELRIGIERLGGMLSVSDEESFVTDESGEVTAELTKLNLPGNNKGNYTLIARVDEHDEVGNIMIKKSVPWGVPVVADSEFFNKRELWSISSRAPFWLIFMAGFILLSVWGTLIYLMVQIFKIRKLGSE